MGIRLLLFSLILLRILIPSALDAGAEPVGLITASKGPVTIKRGQSIPKQAVMGMQVYVGDQLKTSAQSTLQICFLDRSTLALAGGSELVIKDFSFDKDQKPVSRLQILHGTFRFMAGEIAKIAPDSYYIETETATIGIRGSGGSGVSSDGRYGLPKGLLIATEAGHVLRIWPKAGGYYELRHAPRGLVVWAGGATRVYPVTQSLMQLSPSSLLRLSAVQQKSLPPQQPKLPLPQLRVLVCAEARRSEIEIEIEAKVTKPKKALPRRGGDLEASEESSALAMLQRQAIKDVAAEESKAAVTHIFKRKLKD